MNSEQEYWDTKEETDRLIGIYIDWLSEQKEGNWSFKELHRYSLMDYAVYKDGVLQFYLEVKFRRHKKGEYELEKVPISKFTFAFTFSKLKGKKSYLMVKWQDTLGIIDLEDYKRMDEMVARHDRGEDKDLYIMYDHERFTQLKDVFFSYISVI